jgi:curved DNA-binding protein
MEQRVDYKDYYTIMSVDRDASQDDIKRAYRKLARKYHPDVSKEADAEARFKDVGEAYSVLKDPEKRAAYDQLGAGWKAGQDFRPPPNWDAGFEFTGSGFKSGDPGAYSEFFEALFGQDLGSGRKARADYNYQARGEDHHSKVLIDLEDAYNGSTRSITLRSPVLSDDGHVATRDRTLTVKIPKGVLQGQRIRLAQQGAPGHGGGASGDLYLEIDFRPHKRYSVDGRDVYLRVPITPWEAALGATVTVPTPTGAVGLKVPAGTSSGQKLRLKGRGIPSQPPGDLFVTPELTLPPADSDKAKELYRKMQQEMDYDPRASLEA